MPLFKSIRCLLVGAALCALLLCACAAAPSAAPTAISSENAASVPMPDPAGITVYSGAGITVDASNVAEGYVMVKSVPNDMRIKTRLSSGGQAYTYDQRTDEGYETFPLQMGDGAYNVQALEQVEGTTYSRVFSKDMNVTLTSALSPFLYPNQYVEYGRDDAAIARSFQLAEGLTDKAQIAQKLYEFVMKTIEYDYDKAATVKKGYLPVPDETLETKKGICFDYAALLAAMLRAQGIPARLEIGHVAPDNLYHAWNRAYLNGNWVFYDPTLAREGRREQDYTTERIY